jgi:alcohol dehydrogenase class IV
MPLKVWFASGMRAIDHCVEFLCIPSNDDLAVEEATEGLTLLVNGLLKTKEEPDNLNARQDCQLGVVKSISLVRRWILPGASHGIGHMLGPLAKILHGETSAILLPAVCKYNLSLGANVKEQEAVCEILWSIEPARTLFWNGRLTRSGAHLATLLDVLIRELGLPRSLGEVGLSGDMIEKLAKNSLQDPLLERNPIPLRTKEQVLQVLKLCA